MPVLVSSCFLKTPFSISGFTNVFHGLNAYFRKFELFLQSAEPNMLWVFFRRPCLIFPLFFFSFFFLSLIFCSPLSACGILLGGEKEGERGKLVPCNPPLGVDSQSRGGPGS